MASSQNRAKSPLFSSEKSGPSIPHGRDKAIYEHTAGDEIVGLDTDYEALVENLDELSEEQLDELLREARDINQRLRSVERKHTVLRSQRIRKHGRKCIKQIKAKPSSLFASDSTNKNFYGNSSRFNEGNCVHSSWKSWKTRKINCNVTNRNMRT